MKIFLITIILLSFNTTLISAAEDKCVTTLERAKPECNIGKFFDKMKKFSSKHKTIGQSIGMKPSEKKTLKQTLKNLKNK